MTTGERMQEALKPIEPITGSQWRGQIELTHFTGKTNVDDWNAVTCQPTLRWVALIDECEEIGVVRFNPQQKSPFSVEDPNTDYFFSLAKTVRSPIYVDDVEGLQEAMKARNWEKPAQFDAVVSVMQRLSEVEVSQELLAEVFGELAQLPGFKDQRAEDAEECRIWGRDHDHSNLV